MLKLDVSVYFLIPVGKVGNKYICDGILAKFFMECEGIKFKRRPDAGRVQNRND
jgi:hypothetical protein